MKIEWLEDIAAYSLRLRGEIKKELPFRNQNFKTCTSAILIMDFNNIFQSFQIVDSMTIFCKL